MHRTIRSPLLLFVMLLSLSALACGAFVPGRNNPVAVPEVSSPTQPSLPVAQSPANIPPLPPISSSEEALLIQLYERVNPSVVNIRVFEITKDVISSSAQGSGFVYDAQGHIVTNAHVVHGASRVEVTFADGSMRQAEIVGEDLNSDLAVIKVENLPANAAPLPMGNMDNLRVGQNVVAIGNPFGLAGTLTRGVISALGRTIPALNVFSIPQTIQTDAAINPGNSGGPLLNTSGEVIGVNAQIETNGSDRGNVGVGFAIPVSIIQRVVPSLIVDGKYTWAWLGVSGTSLDLALIKGMNLSVETGAYIVRVLENGPAAKAGLRGSSSTIQIDGLSTPIGGDVVIRIDDQPVNSFDDILVYIALKASPGQEVRLTILRDGKQQEIKIMLEPRPQN